MPAERPADRPIDRPALLFALEAEAMPVVRRLGLAEQPRPDASLPMRHFAGRTGALQVHLLINGKDPRCGSDRVGTDAATLAAYVAIRKLSPDLVLNAGTCGGFQAQGGAVGDVYVADGLALYHDRRIPIAGYERQARGEWPVTAAAALRAAIGAKAGTVSTGNSLDFTPDEFAFLVRERVVAKDMEACAIAQVCAQLGVPFVAIKAVTDLVDHPEPVQDVFLRNLHAVSDGLGERVERAVRWLAERPRTIAEL